MNIKSMSELMRGGEEDVAMPLILHIRKRGMNKVRSSDNVRRRREDQM